MVVGGTGEELCPLCHPPSWWDLVGNPLSFEEAGAGSVHSFAEQDIGIWRSSWPAWQVFNPLPDSKALNIIFCH